MRKLLLGTWESQVTLTAPPTCSCPQACLTHARVGGRAAGRWNVAAWRDRMGLNVRAVFFDLDNTLIDTAGASRKGMLEVTAAYPQPSSRRSQRALPGIALSPCSLGALSPLHLRGAGCQMSLLGPGGTVLSFETPVPEGAGKKNDWVGGGCLPSSTAV